MKHRRSFSNEFKRKIVEDIMSETATTATLCRRYNIAHPVITRWKKDYADGKLDNEPSTESGYQEKIVQLERMVGRLTMEKDALKKALRSVHQQQQSNDSSSQITSSLSVVSKGGAKK
jgi:transposase-like protein